MRHSQLSLVGPMQEIAWFQYQEITWVLPEKPGGCNTRESCKYQSSALGQGWV